MQREREREMNKTPRFILISRLLNQELGLELAHSVRPRCNNGLDGRLVDLIYRKRQPSGDYLRMINNLASLVVLVWYLQSVYRTMFAERRLANLCCSSEINFILRAGILIRVQLMGLIRSFVYMKQECVF